jgi:hypothetical protein
MRRLQITENLETAVRPPGILALNFVTRVIGVVNWTLEIGFGDDMVPGRLAEDRFRLDLH